MEDSVAICELDEIDDPGSRAFAIGEGDWPLRGFVVRMADEVFAYLNRCPHAGHPLNWRPDEFLTVDRTLIMCRSHGALFQIDSGLCIGGPCTGQSLRRLPVGVRDGVVILQLSHEIEQLR